MYTLVDIIDWHIINCLQKICIGHVGQRQLAGFKEEEHL